MLATTKHSHMLGARQGRVLRASQPHRPASKLGAAGLNIPNPFAQLFSGGNKAELREARKEEVGGCEKTCVCVACIVQD